MISHDGSRKRLWALAIGLLAAGFAAGDARAGAMTSYSTLGTVDTPAGGIPGLVSFNGMDNAAVPVGGSLNLGNFVVSSLAKTGDTNVNYVNDPVMIYIKSGAASEALMGQINGMVGPTVTNPSLSVTFTSINPINGATLPFVNVPLNTPLPIALSDGTGPASTTLSGANPPPIPEPSSIAVFAVALGGLGLWRRRAGR